MNRALCVTHPVTVPDAAARAGTSCTSVRSVQDADCQCGSALDSFGRGTAGVGDYGGGAAQRRGGLGNGAVTGDGNGLDHLRQHGDQVVVLLELARDILLLEFEGYAMERLRAMGAREVGNPGACAEQGQDDQENYQGLGTDIADAVTSHRVLGAH